MHATINAQDDACQRIRAAALRYAARGLTIFPVPPDCKKSYKSADRSGGRKWGMTSDADEVRADFTRWPHARIGIPTGAVNGIVVIETDTLVGHGVDGAGSLAELEAKHNPLPETLQAISPSGSKHRYLKHPGGGIKIKTTAGALGPGIDVRGDGGMVVAPPSVTLGAGVYRWLNRTPIAAMPAWLIELTQEKPVTIAARAVAAISRPFNGPSGYGNAALKSEIMALASVPPGQRNHALNRAAFSLFQLVGGNELDGAEVERRLIEAATANGLMADRQNGGIKQIMATIRSGARAGLQHPRSRGPHR